MTTTVYAPSLLINKPYSAMGFPEQLRFTPFAVMSNTTDAELPVTFTARFEKYGQGLQTVPLPLAALAPRETRVVDFSQYVTSGLIPTTVGNLSLEISYPARGTALSARIFSMDQSANWVYASDFGKPSARFDLAYWNIEGNQNSVIGVQNVTDDPVEFRVTLSFNSGAGQYKLATVTVPAKVWDYTIGGYQVIKKWLSYREEKILKRPLILDEVRYVQEMTRRIAAILLLTPALDANYDAVKSYTFPWPPKTS